VKKLLIIIPGSKNKSVPAFQFILNRFYSYFGVDKGSETWSLKLKKNISNKIDTVIYNWSGGISETFSINPESERLACYISHLQKYDQIIIFGKSLGGVVAEKAIRKIKEKKKIKKLIYVASPHKSANIKISKDIKIINIYSDKDKYLKFANKILYLGFGRIKLKNAENICIKNLNHSDFNKNKQIIIDNKKINLYDYYLDLILK
jgi:hypothetical protein